MAGGKRRQGAACPMRDCRKGSALSDDERAAVARLRRLRMGADALARALGRSRPDIEAYLAAEARSDA